MKITIIIEREGENILESTMDYRGVPHAQLSPFIERQFLASRLCAKKISKCLTPEEAAMIPKDYTVPG